MKKYIIPIFLASLLLLSACSPQLKESDFILTNEDLNGNVYMKYRALFNAYFTIKDYGGGYMEDGMPFYCLNEDSRQKENIDRFFELANAELEKHQFSPIQTKTVKYSYQELLDASDRISDAAERGEFKFFCLGPSVRKNCLEIQYSDISESYQEKVLKYAPKDMVVFTYAEKGFQLGIVSDDESE